VGDVGVDRFKKCSHFPEEAISSPSSSSCRHYDIYHCVLCVPGMAYDHDISSIQSPKHTKIVSTKGCYCIFLKNCFVIVLVENPGFD